MWNICQINFFPYRRTNFTLSDPHPLYKLFEINMPVIQKRCWFPFHIYTSKKTYFLSEYCVAHMIERGKGSIIAEGEFFVCTLHHILHPPPVHFLSCNAHVIFIWFNSLLHAWQYQKGSKKTRCLAECHHYILGKCVLPFLPSVRLPDLLIFSCAHRPTLASLSNFLVGALLGRIKYNFSALLFAFNQPLLHFISHRNYRWINL